MTWALTGLAVAQPAGTVAPPSGASATAAAASAPSAAQNVPQAARDEARQLYDAGRAAEAKKDLALAYQHYRAAYDLFHHWQIAGALGHVAFALGKQEEAARGLDQFLREAEDLAPSERNQRTKERDDAKKGLALLTIRAPAGTKVFVDGLGVGTAPLGAGGVFVIPGERKVTGKLGDVTMTATATAVVGEKGVETELGVTAAPEVTAAPTSPATAAPTAAPTGTSPGAGVWFSPPRSTIIWAGGAVVLAGIAVGIGSAVAASAKGEEVNRLCPGGLCPGGMEETGQGHENQWATLSNVSFGFFLGAGLAAAGTVTLALALPGASGKRAAVRVHPMGAGLGVTGSW